MANRPLAFLKYKLNSIELDTIKDKFINGYLVNEINLGYNKWNTFYLQQIISNNYYPKTTLVGNFKSNLNNNINLSSNFKIIPYYNSNIILTNDFKQIKIETNDLSNYSITYENNNNYNLINSSLNNNIFILPNEIHLVRKFSLVW